MRHILIASLVFPILVACDEIPTDVPRDGIVDDPTVVGTYEFEGIVAYVDPAGDRTFGVEISDRYATCWTHAEGYGNRIALGTVWMITTGPTNATVFGRTVRFGCYAPAGQEFDPVPDVIAGGTFRDDGPFGKLAAPQ